jgi:hypothetical protein
MLSAGTHDSFVARLDGSGRHVASLRFGDSDDQYGDAVAVTRANEVVAVGTFLGGLDNAGPIQSAGGFDAYLLKLNSTADLLWAKSFGDADSQWATAVAVHPDGSIALAGYFRGTVDFGLGKLVSAGNHDGYLAYFDAQGKILFNKRFGGADFDEALGVAIDGSAGKIAITGFVANDEDFGCGTLPAGGGPDAFVAVFDTLGHCSYSVRFGDHLNQVGRAVAFDSNHNLIVVGSFGGSLGLGAMPPQTNGDDDAFVAKFDPGGQVQSIRVLGGGQGNQIANAVGTDGAGNIFVAGSFTESIDFGAAHIACRSYGNAFLARMSP